MSDLLIKNMGIPKDRPIGVVIHPSGRVEVPDSFEAGFSYPRVVGVNLLRAHEITDHGDLKDTNKILQWLNRICDERQSVSVGEIIDYIEDAPTIIKAST